MDGVPLLQLLQILLLDHIRQSGVPELMFHTSSLFDSCIPDPVLGHRLPLNFLVAYYHQFSSVISPVQMVVSLWQIQ